MDDTEQQTASDTTSQTFVGRWNRLITTTNWEKGRIICQWREALESEESPAAEYSDEQWARQVEHVSGQHVGRLRRVYQRFGQNFSSYEGLFWSHFQAALDWDDAEMWLEGASQNDWSVSSMRNQRWETIGSPEQSRPLPEDIVSSEIDEDVEPTDAAEPSDDVAISNSDAAAAEGDTEASANAQRDADESVDDGASGGYQDAVASSAPTAEAELPQPFAELNELPGDLGDAFESFKLALLHHRLEGWKQVSCRDAVAALDALRSLAMAPVTESE